MGELALLVQRSVGVIQHFRWREGRQGGTPVEWQWRHLSVVGSSGEGVTKVPWTLPGLHGATDATRNPLLV